MIAPISFYHVGVFVDEFNTSPDVFIEEPFGYI